MAYLELHAAQLSKGDLLVLEYGNCRITGVRFSCFDGKSASGDDFVQVELQPTLGRERFRRVFFTDETVTIAAGVIAVEA